MGVSTCPQCGHTFSPEEVDSELAGMCPVCLAGVATADPQSFTSEDQPHPEIQPAQKETVYSPFKPGGKFRDLEIIGQLGQGGMGVVYKARQVKLDRLVALKVLAPQYAASPEFIQRFEREAKILASVNHPNVIQVYDFGKEGDVLFLVLELVEGQDLETVFKKTKTVNVPRFLHVIREATKALEAIHDVGLIHRDVKPANVLLTKSGVTKLTDFGLAIDTEAKEKLTQSGLFVGTPHYVSPEHVQGKKIDARSDLYSVGVILFEDMAGRPPFDAASNTALLMKHVQEAPPPLHKYAPNTPKEIGAVVRKLLAKNPASRHDSAATLLKDLDRAIEAAKTQGTTKRSVVGDFRILESEDAPPKTRRASAATPAKTLPWKLISGCGATAVILVIALVFLLGGSDEEVKAKLPPPKTAKARPRPPATPNTPATATVSPKPTPKAVTPVPVPKPAPPQPDPVPPETKPEEKQDSTSKILEKALKDGDTLLEEARKQYESGKAKKSVSFLTQASFKAEEARVKYQAVIELGEGPLKQKAVAQTRAVQQLIKLTNEEKLAISAPSPAPTSQPKPSAKTPVPKNSAGSPIPAVKKPLEQTAKQPASPQEEATPKKLPVPSAKEQKEAEKAIRKLFKAEYSKRSPEDVIALGGKLLESGKDPSVEKATKFVLLREARDNAALAGDIDTSFAAINELYSHFAILPSEMKHAALERARRNARTSDALIQLTTAWMSLIDEAIETGDFKTATAAAKAALTSAGKTRDKALITQARGKSSYVAGLKREFDKAKRAFIAIKKDPEDPDANLALGRLFCFAAGGWDLGLRHLAKCSDEELKSVAILDRTNPSDPESQVRVGDAWLDLADKKKSDKKNIEMQIRGRYWYEKAIPRLSGLALVKTEKRLFEGSYVYKVVLWNTHNWHYFDRGALECAVTFVDQGGTTVGERRNIPIEWIRGKPSSSQVILQCRRKPSKLLVEVTKCYRVSAGLAEIELFRLRQNLVKGVKPSAKPEGNLDPKNLTDGIREATGSGKGYWYTEAETAEIEINIPRH